MKKFLVMFVSFVVLVLWSSSMASYTAEQQNAYSYAYNQKIITASSIEKANMNGQLTRIAMAKMISNFAINVLWLQPNTYINCSFSDVSSSLDSQYSYGVTQACQLWLMWIWSDWKKSDKFNPYEIVTRAQFATAFSRALNKSKWTVINNGTPYYSTHLQYLQSEWIIRSISQPLPSTVEKRWNVMLMMMRASNVVSSSENLDWNKEYYYKSLDIKANIWLDWNVDVLENFNAYFNVDKHGIIRAIPSSKVTISGVNVKWKTFVTYVEDWNINIKIGDADKTVRWDQIYPISYKVDWLIRNSQLYRNLVWYDFDTNINKVSAEIILPKAYTWFTKDDFLITTDWKSKTIDWFDWTVDWSKWDRIIINYNKWLPAYQWITLAVKFPNDYFESEDDEISDTSSDDQFQKISAEKLAKLKDKWVIRWPKNAKITIVEFTELLCPYCQRQSQQWTITSVMQQFSGQVNSISKSFIIHGDTALQLHSVMECVANLKPWVYYDVLDGAFWAYPIDMTGVVNIAVENWVNKKSLQECIDEWRYIQSIINIMNIWSELWVYWTPWSIVINNETLRYELISWAYPIEIFVDTIEHLLN